MANINKSKWLLKLIQGKVWTNKMFSDALLSSGIPESQQIHVPTWYKECAGVKCFQYEVNAKYLPWDWDLHEEWCCLIKRGMMPHFWAARVMDDAHFCHQLHLSKPSHRREQRAGQHMQAGALGTGQCGSMRDRRGLQKRLAYCHETSLLLIVTSNKLFYEIRSMGERGE